MFSGAKSRLSDAVMVKKPPILLLKGILETYSKQGGVYLA